MTARSRTDSKGDALPYLSNHLSGKPPLAVSTYRDADLPGRRRIAAENSDLRRVAIWQLHDVATLATKNPVSAIPFAELGLDMVKVLGEDDLLSWGYSELGNIYRLTGDTRARDFLDRGVALAHSPYQVASALQQRGVFELSTPDEEHAQAALGYMERALQVSPTGDDRIDSDRGHAAVLASAGLAHLHLSTYDRDPHLATAKRLYLEILEQACPRHGKRSCRVAVLNLASISNNFDEPLSSSLIKRFRALATSRAIPKSSLQGALIQWTLIHSEIRTSGYDWSKRRQLLTVLKHLVKHRAFDRAALLTLFIGSLDSAKGMRAISFLQKDPALMILRQGGQKDLAERLRRMDRVDIEPLTEIIELVGNPRYAIKTTMKPCARSAKRKRNIGAPYEYLSNYRSGQPPLAVLAYRKADLSGRRRIAAKTSDLRRIAIWQLHDVATLATKNPVSAIPFAELGLDMVKVLEEDDLLSWGYSELGNIYRLTGDTRARDFLDRGVALAHSPYQAASALQQRGVLELSAPDEEHAQAALGYMERALQVSPTGDNRIDSDRGHAAVLASAGLAHLHLSKYDRDPHLNTAKRFYLEILKHACPRHGKRSRRVAVLNLASISNNFDEPLSSSLIERFRALATAREIPKSSLQGALIQWTLIHSEIRTFGYDRNRRRRLLTVRNHLLENKSFDRAASLTLFISALDTAFGMRALGFLQKSASVTALKKGGYAKFADYFSRMEYQLNSRQEVASAILDLITRAGMGDARLLNTET